MSIMNFIALPGCQKPQTLRSQKQSLQCSFSHAARIQRPFTTMTQLKATLNDNDLGSLIPQTLDELDSDPETQILHDRVARLGQAALTRQEERLRKRSLDNLGIPSFETFCSNQGTSPLFRSPATIFQLNIGLYCNQACRHCHVESSPRRTELMSREVAERCIQLMDTSPSIKTVDITGGAPELCPQFEYIVQEAFQRGYEIIDRCNLTVLFEPGQENLADFLAQHKVRVVASLPCYSAVNVDSQRGRGVFERSIAALQKLNSVGYGAPGSDLSLDLVYNPGGVFLAPSQNVLEDTYRQELWEAYQIQFSHLLCLNNMPIKRWADELVRRDQLEEYMQLLINSFNPAAASSLMCRNTISIGWDGALYDCDFNQQLDLGIHTTNDESVKKNGLNVFEIESLADLTGKPIVVGSHCFGCTAGSGSSCQGATT